jgi:hypothetical protein
MFRSNFLSINNIRYNNNLKSTEDWELWMRISQTGKIANLNDFLMKYRIHENSNHRELSKQKEHYQERAQIVYSYWKLLSKSESKLTKEEITLLYYNDILKHNFSDKFMLNLIEKYGLSADAVLKGNSSSLNEIKTRFANAHIRFLKKNNLLITLSGYNTYKNRKYAFTLTYIKACLKLLLDK